MPVLSTWLIRKAHGEEGKGLFGRLRSIYRSYLQVVLRLRWPLVAGYLIVSIGLLYIFLPGLGTEIFPDANAPLLRLRLRMPAGMRIEETERNVLKALHVIDQEAGPGNVQISSDFMGVQPPSYPVNLIHLFTAGPGEAIIQVSLKADAARGESLREKLRAALERELPGARSLVRSCRHREPGDGFRFADARRSRCPGVNLQDDSAHAQKAP